MNRPYWNRLAIIAASLGMFAYLPALAIAARDAGNVDGNIDVISHIVLPGTTVSGIQPTTEAGRELVGLTDDSHKMFTVVDVTDAPNPIIAEKFALPSEMANPTLEAMGGKEILMSHDAEPRAGTPQSLSIISFRDPEHPAVVRTFENISAMYRGPGGMIYLANRDGLWILKAKQAEDKTLDAAYQNYVLYGSSRFLPQTRSFH